MGIILIILSFLSIDLVTANDWGPDTVFVTSEFAHYESSWDVSPLISATRSLDVLTEKIEHSTHFAKMTNPVNKKLVSWLIDHIRLTLAHTRTTIRELGFLASETQVSLPKRIKRVKRAPFAFIGQIQSSLFGTVTEEDFESFKDSIRKSFAVYQTDSSVIRSLIADNRNALLRTLDVVQSENYELSNRIEVLEDDLKLISRLFQATFSISSIERITMVLGTIRSSCDKNLISRHIIPPSVLSSYLLHLSDKLKGLNPVFNTIQREAYFKLQLAVSTISGLEIKQIASIPVISVNDQFTVSSAKCPSSHICLENRLGKMAVPTAQFLRCHGSTVTGLPTICPLRQCLTSSISVCSSSNHTSFLVSTLEPFDAVIKCQKNEDKVTISNITYLHVPTDCSVSSTHLTIPVILTMITTGMSHTIIQIPFAIKANQIIFNTTDLDGSVKRQINFKGVKEILATKIPKAPQLDTSFQVKLHKTLSIGALSISSTLALFVVVSAVLIVIFRAKIVTCLQ